MRKGLVFGAVAAALVLAGCAYDYGYPYGYGVAAGYGPPIYYDDFYGPYWGGYWGPDGGFWFSTGPGRPFVRDAGGHFRSFGGIGFYRVHDSGTVKTHS
jgi:hypothetical protein